MRISNNFLSYRIFKVSLICLSISIIWNEYALPDDWQRHLKTVISKLKPDQSKTTFYVISEEGYTKPEIRVDGRKLQIFRTLRSDEELGKSELWKGQSSLKGIHGVTIEPPRPPDDPDDPDYPMMPVRRSKCKTRNDLGELVTYTCYWICRDNKGGIPCFASGPPETYRIGMGPGAVVVHDGIQFTEANLYDQIRCMVFENPHNWQRVKVKIDYELGTPIRLPGVEHIEIEYDSVIRLVAAVAGLYVFNIDPTTEKIGINLLPWANDNKPKECADLRLLYPAQKKRNRLKNWTIKSQTFTNGMEVLCNAPLEVAQEPWFKTATFTERSLRLDNWIRLRLQNEEALLIFDKFPILFSNELEKMLRKAAMTAGLANCPFADLCKSHFAEWKQ